MEKLVSMKKLVSLGLVFVLAAVFAISAFAAPADAEEIVPLSRGSYYLTSGYTTIASVSTGLGTSSIEVYNLAENGAGIWVRMVTISIAIEHIITPFLVIFNVLFDLFSFGFAAVLFAVPAGVRVLHPQGADAFQRNGRQSPCTA